MAARVSVRFDGGDVVVRLDGPLDHAVAGQVRRALGDLIDAGHQLVRLELEDVTGCDATGLAVVIAAAGRARRRGQRLAVTTSNPVMDRVLRFSREPDLAALPVSA